MNREMDVEVLAELHTIQSYAAETDDLGALEAFAEEVALRSGLSTSTLLGVRCELELMRCRGRRLADSAAAWSRLADTAARAGLPQDDPTWMSIRSLHAQFTRRRGEPGDGHLGVRMYEEEWRLRTGLLGPNDPRTAIAHANLALAVRERGDPGDLDRAHQMLQSEARRRAEFYGAGHPFTWIAQVILAQTLIRRAEAAGEAGERRRLAGEAAEVARAMLESRHRRYGGSDHSTLLAHLVHAQALMALDRADEAVPEIRTVQNREGRPGAGLDPGWTDLLLAQALRDHDPADAYAHALTALRLRGQRYGPTSKQIAEVEALAAKLSARLDER